MIETWIMEALGNVWGAIVYYLTFQFLDPLWKYTAYALVITLAIVFLLWLFGGINKWIKPIGGGIIVVMWLMWEAFRRGMAAARYHDAKRAPEQSEHEPEPEPKPAPRQGDGAVWNPFGKR